MTDITRFKNVSLSKKTYSDVGVLSKAIFDVPLSLSKTIEYLVEKEIKKVYQFLDLPYYPHYFTNLKQIMVNGISYNDGVVGKNMHTIRTEKIMKVENYYKSMIPERFVKEYGHIRF